MINIQRVQPDPNRDRLRRLPATLRVVVKLETEMRHGKPCLCAAYTNPRDNESYKLIVIPDPREKFVCQSGETWDVKIDKTTLKGNEICCWPRKIVLTATGKHPAEDAFQKHVAQNGVIAIDEQFIDRTVRRLKLTKGTITSYVFEDRGNKILLSLRQAALYEPGMAKSRYLGETTYEILVNPDYGEWTWIAKTKTLHCRNNGKVWDISLLSQW